MLRQCVGAGITEDNVVALLLYAAKDRLCFRRGAEQINVNIVPHELAELPRIVADVGIRDQGSFLRQCVGELQGEKNVVHGDFDIQYRQGKGFPEDPGCGAAGDNDVVVAVEVLPGDGQPLLQIPYKRRQFDLGILLPNRLHQLLHALVGSDTQNTNWIHVSLLKVFYF